LNFFFRYFFFPPQGAPGPKHLPLTNQPIRPSDFHSLLGRRRIYFSTFVDCFGLMELSLSLLVTHLAVQAFHCLVRAIHCRPQLNLCVSYPLKRNCLNFLFRLRCFAVRWLRCPATAPPRYSVTPPQCHKKVVGPGSQVFPPAGRFNGTDVFLSRVLTPR